jgi:hypothetical protein
LHRQNIQEATDGIRRHLIAVREPDDLKTVLDIELVRELDLLGIPIDSLSIELPTSDPAYSGPLSSALP